MKECPSSGAQTLGEAEQRSTESTHSAHRLRDVMLAFPHPSIYLYVRDFF